MNQRHVHFLALSAPLPQILAHQRGADWIPLAHQLPLNPGPGQPLLRGGPRLPLRQQLVQPRPDLCPYRPLPARRLRTDSDWRKYLLIVWRLSPSSRATRRTLCPSTSTLCRITCT